MGLSELPESEERLRPLTRLQNAFWILDQLSPTSGVSNLELTFRTAPVRWWPLHVAANRLLHRHPALRLRFPEEGGLPIRHLTAPDDAGIAVESRSVPAAELTAVLQRFARTPFDLTREFPLRVGCFQTPGADSSVISVVLHHISSDIVSCRILVEELCRTYDAVAGNNELPTDLRDPVPMLERTEPSQEAVRYWVEQLRGVDPDAMVLPSATRRVETTPTFDGVTHRHFLSEPGRAALRALRTQLRVTDNVVLLSAFYLTLLRHGAGPDLVVGVPVGTRTPEQRALVGLGISTMALRVSADPEAGFDALVRQTRDAFLHGVEHSEASVEAVVTELGHRSADWRVPVFRHAYNYRAWEIGHVTLAGEPVEFLRFDDRSRLDIDFVAVPGPDEVLLRITYATDVHRHADIALFAERMDALLQRAAEDAGRPLLELDATGPSDRALVDRLAATRRRWAPPATVLEQVADKAAATPGSTAVVDGSRVTSYGELVAWAAAVRDQLAASGVGAGDVVALAMRRGTEMVAAVLGCWAVGAHYLPLDPRHPAERLEYQVRDSNARLVMTGERDDASSWRPGCSVAVVPPAPPSNGAVLEPPAPGGAAYVIYTSGSTGRPKGVRVSHGSLANVVSHFAALLEADASATMLWSTTPSFDISMLELLLPLSVGGRVVVAGDEAQTDPRLFLDLLAEHGVTVVQATPTAWKVIAAEAVQQLAGRTVLCGGEPLPAALARRLVGLGCRLFNVYGPTETTIWSTAVEITGSVRDPVPVGVPIANTTIFVTGQDGCEVLPGVAGELCIAGDGVSIGYVGLPELTAERFGEHPRWGRFYRTGDLGRLRTDDGMIEVLGRNDRQVKLRGHRIELGEVEAVLHDHPGVLAAAVTTDGDLQGEDGRLLAYVRPGAAADPDALVSDLWRHSLARLPHYSMPGRITVVESFPTTPNDKIDYSLLAATVPEPAPEDPTPEPAANSELARALLELWRHELSRPSLRAGDNFFLNGGHSLLAMRIAPSMAELAGCAVTAKDVFDHPTAARLAAYLSGPDEKRADD